MKNLGQFFQDSNEQFSATRLAFLAWIFGALIVWGTGSIQAKEMQKIPESVTALIGILMTGKVFQKFGEVHESINQTSEDSRLTNPASTGNGNSVLTGHSGLR
ncbi:hypothetical protein [Nodosilinea nodulosa]|uniref:hypothetical protein n=1 Tax=Nodosilinea nodulosa TaxID=416001 RepID=UPI00035D9CE3|nr:hypothetical protein [Nodosilinea nodulosa]